MHVSTLKEKNLMKGKMVEVKELEGEEMEERKEHM